MKSDTQWQMEFSDGFNGICSARNFAFDKNHFLLSVTPHGTGKRAACTITKNKAAIQSQLRALTTEHSQLKNFLLKKKCKLDDADDSAPRVKAKKTAVVDYITID